MFLGPWAPAPLAHAQIRPWLPAQSGQDAHAAYLAALAAPQDEPPLPDRIGTITTATIY